MNRCLAGAAARAPRFARSIASVALLIALAGCGSEQVELPAVVLATTHTVEDSGLLEVLDSAFAAAHPELRLRVVVAGSGEVLEIGRRADADVLITHAPAAELRFVEDGYGVDRRAIMHNDFVVYGPSADPAGVASAKDAAEAFARIAAAGAPFVSRGDDSGTHRKELAIWRLAGIVPAGDWYLEAGLGQADALRVASERGAYMLADRATYTVLRPSLRLMPLVRGDSMLINRYAVTLITRAANATGARTFADWVVGPAAAALIRGLGRDADGVPLFIPASEP